MKKRIFVAYTGGTLGMRRTPDGYVPESGLGELLKETMPSHLMVDMPDYVLHEYDTLIDSANIQPRDWHYIASNILSNYHNFDGFVVLHGTDTMAYTASALSFIFRGLQKPIIVTGSQIPLREMRNDARNNLITTLILAAHYAIPEVCLYFNGRLIRGNRSTKVKAEGFDAFDSPNYPLLGEVGINISIHHSAIRERKEPELFQLPSYDACNVAVLRLFPGLSSDLLAKLMEPPVQGVIIQAYGVGNAPVAHGRFLQVLEEATHHGVIVVAISQCPEGRVDLSQYAAGSALAKVGVIGGYDMTTEAAFTKLHHLLALDLSVQEVKTLMQRDLCGECTPSDQTARSG